MENKGFRSGRKKPFFALFILIMFFVLTAIVMLLWNALVPGITGWKPVNYWQSAGLLILCRILSGRFGSPMNHRRQSPFMMRKFREKFANASPEEREALKSEWKRRCRDRNN